MTRYLVEFPIPADEFKAAVRDLMSVRSCLDKPISHEDATRLVANLILCDTEGEIN